MAALPRVLILNGPNLNLLGTREVEIYGKVTLADIHALCTARGDALGLAVDCRQSNHEGQLIDWIHEARSGASALIINAGAYTHTSIALHDALRAFLKPIFEVHLSNIYQREPFRHQSLISKVAQGVISGFGPLGYELALEAAAREIGPSRPHSPASGDETLLA